MPLRLTSNCTGMAPSAPRRARADTAAVNIIGFVIVNMVGGAGYSIPKALWLTTINGQDSVALFVGLAIVGFLGSQTLPHLRFSSSQRNWPTFYACIECALALSDRPWQSCDRRSTQQQQLQSLLVPNQRAPTVAPKAISPNSPIEPPLYHTTIPRQSHHNAGLYMHVSFPICVYWEPLAGHLGWH